MVGGVNRDGPRHDEKDSERLAKESLKRKRFADDDVGCYGADVESIEIQRDGTRRKSQGNTQSRPDDVGCYGADVESIEIQRDGTRRKSQESTSTSSSPQRGDKYQAYTDSDLVNRLITDNIVGAAKENVKRAHNEFVKCDLEATTSACSSAVSLRRTSRDDDDDDDGGGNGARNATTAKSHGESDDRARRSDVDASGWWDSFVEKRTAQQNLNDRESKVLQIRSRLNICKHLNTDMSGSCWSLLAMLDVGKISSVMKLRDKGSIKELRESVQRINIELQRLQDYSTRHNIDINFVRINDDDDNDDDDDDGGDGGAAAADGGNDGNRHADDSFDGKTLSDMMLELDVATHTLMSLILQRMSLSSSSVSSSLATHIVSFFKYAQFATVNGIFNEDVLNYLTKVITFKQEFVCEKEYERGVKLAGTFLVSLERVQNMRFKFESLTDRGNILRIVIGRYMRSTCEQTLKDCPVPIYVNISERKNVTRLKILSDDANDYELACVDLASCVYSRLKNTIVVKAYMNILISK